MLGLQFCGLTGLVIITANLLKYVHVLKIEGEIALLSLDCNNCYTAHHRRTHRKKRFVRIVRFLYQIKRIIISSCIFLFFRVSISYQDIDFCTRLLGRLEKIKE